MTDDTRAEFEQWWDRSHFLFDAKEKESRFATYVDGKYKLDIVDRSWRGWQAMLAFHLNERANWDTEREWLRNKCDQLREQRNAERTRCAAIARKHGAEDAAREMEG